MNVAYVSYEFPGFRSWGGAATSSLMVAKSLSTQNVTLTMYIAGDTDSCLIHSSNVKIQVVGCLDVSEFRHRVAQRILEQHLICNFDVIESCDGDGQGYLVAETLPDVPFVTRSHTPLRMIHHFNQQISRLFAHVKRIRLISLMPFRHFFKNRYTNDLEFRQFKKSAAISCSSRLLSKSLRWFYPISSKLEIVPYAIDCTTIKEPKCPSGCITFGFVGSIDNRKGLVELLQALEYLIERGLSFNFKFAGKLCLKGHTHKHFESMLDKHSAVVTYSGEFDYCDIQSVFDDIDVLVLPSRFDSYGYVCMEASLNGCGLVCSSSVGASELIKGVDAKCVHRSYSYKSLVRSMEHMIELYTFTPNVFVRRIKEIQCNTVSTHSLENAGSLHFNLLHQVSKLIVVR
jgi:glycogen(starch) synthase